ncbi:MAG: cupin [Okeania sp. SIO2F4]|uniref:cupin domain-containing protein n=1 Tax=Okeania sp. SIO2F4 TaxID=2607790 RepID=UPI00142AFE13|nr:cupin domain-containing protein [Okeania sp. SIO2F4]NES01663.1 cupin [Okeania sp. SIO2F4]
MSCLTNLIQPLDQEEFLENNWTRKAIAISSKGHKNFTDLFSWDKLNHLLNFHQIEYPDLRLAFDGKVLEGKENRNLTQWCEKGATLILDQIHKRVPEVSLFASKLSYELGYPTQVNAYCSWSSKKGFSKHYDTHDVFILQVEGSKQWYVYTDTFKYPLPNQKSSSFVPPEEEAYLSCILHPGDVLYIPRGHWHYAVTKEEPSIHLTLGIHSRTGVDLLEWLIGQLQHKEEWRKSLPLRIDETSFNLDVENLIQDLEGYINNHNISEEYNNYLDGLGKPVEAYSLPYQAGFNIFDNGVETKFKISQFQRLKILQMADEDGYKILVSGKEVSIRGVPEYLVKNLFSQETFTGKDVRNLLPDYDWEIDIMPLLSRLVSERVIFVEPGV